jgi:hypothetical protein
MMTTHPKGYKGLPMEGFIATWYAKNTRKDMGELRQLATVVAAQIAAGSRILEIAPGPGYLAIELAKLGTYTIVGLVLRFRIDAQVYAASFRQFSWASENAL